MATPQLLMTTEQEEPITTPNFMSDEINRSGPTRPRGSRKSGRVPTQKKQPQRGLGVAQLERLRLQDRWKKITEIPPPQPPLPFRDPLSGVPVQYGEAANYGGQPMMNGCGNGVWDFGGYGYGSCGGGGGLVVVDHYQYGIGAPDPRVQIGTSNVETSKELSSMPKIHCVADRCDICFKKKRFASNIGFSEGRDKNTSNNSSEFLGLNPGNTTNFIGGEYSRWTRTHSGYTVCNLNKGAEVKQIHRKGSSSVGGGILMEYEFFPGKSSGKSIATSKEMEWATEEDHEVEEAGSVVAVNGEASFITNSTFRSASDSTSLDLSLKL